MFSTEGCSLRGSDMSLTSPVYLLDISEITGRLNMRRDEAIGLKRPYAMLSKLCTSNINVKGLRYVRCVLNKLMTNYGK
jgi:hypothetical protein